MNILTSPLGLAAEMLSGYSFTSLTENKVKGTTEKDDCEDREAEDSEELEYEINLSSSLNQLLQYPTIFNYYITSFQISNSVFLEKISPPPKSC